MTAHTDIAASGWVSRLPRAGCRICCWRGSTGRSASGCCSCRDCGGSCWRGRLAADRPADRAVRRRQPGDAGGRLRGERPVGSRHRPPGRAHRRPAAGLGRDPAAAGAGVSGRAAGLRAAGAAAAQPAGPGTGGGIAAAGRAVSAGEAGHLVAATGDGLHLRLRRAAGLCRRRRADRCCPGRALRAPRSAGTSASTRSTPTRTARTTRWSACVPPPGCSASGRGRSWRRATARAVLLLALAGGLAGLGGWFFIALVLPAGLLARQVPPWTSTTPAGACACSAPIARSGWPSRSRC